jgi:hypothetical protein
MPDALYQAADQLAPAPPRTNFFDPAASQTILSRYANTRRSAAGLEALGKATGDLADAQMRMEDQQLQREAADRNRTIFDRETQDYQDKQNFKKSQGQFLISLAGLNPEDAKFQDHVSELLAGANEVIVQDPAAQAILHAKNAAWENMQRQRVQEDYRKQIRDEARANSDQRNAVKLASQGLKPEEFVYDPVTQELDVVASMAKAVEKKGTTKSAEETAKEAEKEPDRIKKAVEPLLMDLDAFPTGAMAVGREGVDASGEPKASQEARIKAKAWDENRPLAEIEAAKGYKTAEAYANAMDTYLSSRNLPGLTSDQKAKRRALWWLATGKPEAPKVRRYNLKTGKIETIQE